MHKHRDPVIFTLLALALACGATSTQAVAATYHVSPYGSNTPPYDTYAKAANDPRSAIDWASGYGDTVLIHAGNYDVDTAIVLPKGLVVHGVSRDSSRLVWVGPYLTSPTQMFTAQYMVGWGLEASHSAMPHSHVIQYTHVNERS